MSEDRLMTITEWADMLRNKCLAIEKSARAMMNHETYRGEQAFKNQHGEMKAQTMLAVRRLEDARMRLGKVCQYAGDGVSIYDKV
jgi:hypothetical protein